MQAQTGNMSALSRPSTRAPGGSSSSAARLQQRGASVRTNALFGQKKAKRQVGFRWDPGNLRWVRDDRRGGLADDDDDKTLIKPRTGAAYRAWPVVHTTLSEAGLRSVDVFEAAKMAKSGGWTVMDVRLESDFDAQHAAGAVNVPLFRLVQGSDLWSNLKKAAMASFAMSATERNPDFAGDAVKALGRKNSRVLVQCAVGGTLDVNARYRREKRVFADPERQFGRESRSLKAAYELLEAGWSINNIVHVDGGFQVWRHEGLPCVPALEEGEAMGPRLRRLRERRRDA